MKCNKKQAAQNSISWWRKIRAQNCGFDYGLYGRAEVALQNKEFLQVVSPSKLRRRNTNKCYESKYFDLKLYAYFEIKQLTTWR